MSEDLVLDERDLLGAPSPFAHVVALGGGDTPKRPVERARHRARAIGIGRAYRRVVLGERYRSGRDLRAELGIQVDAGLFRDERDVELIEKGLGDQRLGSPGVGRSVPGGDQRQGAPLLLVGGFDGGHQRLQRLHGERQMIHLHGLGGGEVLLLGPIQQLLDAPRAPRLLPVAAEGRLLGDGRDGVVGVEQKARRRVQRLRLLLEGQETCPIKLARGAVDRRQPVARLAHGHEAGALEADVAVDIGVDDVLRRRLEQTQRRQKLVPVPRLVEPDDRFEARVLVAKSREGERHDLALPGDCAHAGVYIGQDGSVPRRAHGQAHVGLALDVNDLLASLETAAGRRASDIWRHRRDRPSRRTDPACRSAPW